MLYSYKLSKKKIKMLPQVQIRQKGFTLIEILLVIALIAILAGIVIFAINIPKQLAAARDTQRRSDVNSLLNAVYQYSIDNGSIPASINHSDNCGAYPANEICRVKNNCSGVTELSVLTDDQKYLVDIPADPSYTGYGSGYFVYANTNNRVTVCAPYAESGTTISVTR